MTAEDKARFLDAYPLLLDDVQAIDKALGREPLHATGTSVRDRHRQEVLQARRVQVEEGRAEALPRRLHPDRPQRREGGEGRRRRRLRA